MHAISPGDVVRSHAGRDRESYFFVLDVVGGYALLADGKLRRVESPKRKNLRHIAFITDEESKVRIKILRGDKLQNAEIRKALAAMVGAAE